MTITYFAYGANLDIEAMATRCPGAAVLERGQLPAHRLVAMREGWLSIEPAEDEVVEGLLWRLDDVHLVALDTYEEVHEGLYTHDRALIHRADGTACEALVYQGSNGGPGVLHAEYAERVARAAERTLGAAQAARIRALGPA
ncbi:MAG: gamma-glutamylcyclotransferase [Phycisphaerales bacterium]|nr:gamma-glutamylcyclotransferase [Phycisphaerales bacterium]